MISIIGQKYRDEFFNNSNLNKSKESNVWTHTFSTKAKENHKIKENLVKEQSLEQFFDKEIPNSTEKESWSFYSELSEGWEILKMRNESTIMKILPSSVKEQETIEINDKYDEESK